LEIRKKRRTNAREAKKELERIDHPVNLETGAPQTSERIKERFNEQLQLTDTCAADADLSSGCRKRQVDLRSNNMTRIRELHIETGFPIFFNAFQQFNDYPVVASLSGHLLKETGYIGLYQPARFHPPYRFANSEKNDGG